MKVIFLNVLNLGVDIHKLLDQKEVFWSPKEAKNNDFLTFCLTYQQGLLFWFFQLSPPFDILLVPETRHLGLSKEPSRALFRHREVPQTWSTRQEIFCCYVPTTFWQKRQISEDGHPNVR